MVAETRAVLSWLSFGVCSPYLSHLFFLLLQINDDYVKGIKTVHFLRVPLSLSCSLTFFFGVVKLIDCNSFLENDLICQLCNCNCF